MVIQDDCSFKWKCRSNILSFSFSRVCQLHPKLASRGKIRLKHRFHTARRRDTMRQWRHGSQLRPTHVAHSPHCAHQPTARVRILPGMALDVVLFAAKWLFIIRSLPFLISMNHIGFCSCLGENFWTASKQMMENTHLSSLNLTKQEYTRIKS